MAEVGVCRVRTFSGVDPLDAPQLFIERADDEVFITDEIIEAAANGGASPMVTFGENILTIRGVNRTVSYGLVSYDLMRNVWLGRKSPEIQPPNDDLDDLT